MPSLKQVLSQDLTLGQKEFLMDTIKEVVIANPDNEKIIASLLDEDPELCNMLLKVQ